MARMIEELTAKFMGNAQSQPDGMIECENFSFEINPYTQCALFSGSIWFEPVVAAAQFLWYFNGDRDDLSIYKYLPSYKATRNDNMPYHNSNYGFYFYKLHLLTQCVIELTINRNSRRATFLINSNDVMFGGQRDKLCTNSVSFRIRKNKLNMTVHMRSNDFLNMMPYDVFQFCMAYGIVFSELKKTYSELKIGSYFHFADSMHTDRVSSIGLKTFRFMKCNDVLIPDFNNPNFKTNAFNYFSYLVNNHESKNQ